VIPGIRSRLAVLAGTAVYDSVHSGTFPDEEGGAVPRAGETLISGLGQESLKSGDPAGIPGTIRGFARSNLR